MSQIRQAQMFKKHEYSIIPSQKGEMDGYEWLPDLGKYLIVPFVELSEHGLMC